jgi:hypothetical protein
MQTCGASRRTTKATVQCSAAVKHSVSLLLIACSKLPTVPFIKQFGPNNLMTATSHSSLTVVPPSASWTVSLEKLKYPAARILGIGGTGPQFHELR